MHLEIVVLCSLVIALTLQIQLLMGLVDNRMSPIGYLAYWLHVDVPIKVLVYILID